MVLQLGWPEEPRVERAAELSREGQDHRGGLPVGGWGAQVVVRRGHMEGKKYAEITEDAALSTGPACRFPGEA